ncbi:MAG: gfo/Idh/MocA family oxidoreductase, partial [Phycisphaerales bacterium]
MRPSQALSRRRLLIGTAGLTVAGIVPSRVLAGSGRIPPSEQLNVAVIGTGGQGITNIKNLLTHPVVNIVAICDPAEFWD